MLQTKELVNTTGAFSHCESLTSLDLSSLDFSSLNFSDYMFSGCSSLKNLTLPNYIPSISNTINMFENCYSLVSINLTFLELATEWVDANGMFSGCIGLTEIIFPKLNAKLLFDTTKMFSGCYNLNNINLEGINSGTIFSMDSMFENCSNLENLNIKNLDTRNVYSLEHIFYGINKKIKIIYNPKIIGNKLMKEINNISG